MRPRLRAWTRLLAGTLGLGLLALAAGAGPSRAAAYSGLYVFGDSLSDVGNVFLSTSGAIPAAPYYQGRFSNGPNWVDNFAAILGLGPVLPSVIGGNDYAFGGAVTSTAVPGASTAVPNIVQQVGLFTVANGGHAPSSGLYTLWIGGNDIATALDDLIAGTLGLAEAQADLTAAAQIAASALGTLAAEGAEHFLVPLIPDLGVTPNVTDVPGLAPVATALTKIYNTALLAAIGTDTAGEAVDVHYFDTFSLLDAGAGNPGAFGFNDAVDRCYVGTIAGGGSVCATPDTYLFWDGQHPSAATDRIIAAEAAAALPEPSTLALLLTALGLSVAASVRRAAAPRRKMAVAAARH